MTVTIWHNPRCSKSRQTLALLEERGIEPDVVRYLDAQPTKEQLADVLKLLGISASQLIRKGESIYKELGLSAESTEDELISAMADNPILIERPVVLANGKASLGRPPESVLTIL